MIRRNSGTLVWYDNLGEQHKYKPYVNGSKDFPVVSEINQIPPFQLVKDVAPGAVTSFLIVRDSTGVQTDVTAAIITAGLEVISFAADGYYVISYPANSVISGPVLEQGLYYCIMVQGGDTHYSERFYMCSDVSELLKIEYCHENDIIFPGNNGRLVYSNGYKNFLYVNTNIGKPTYEYENTVTRREGRDLPLNQISWKQSTFVLLAIEEVIDFLRLIPLHDSVKLITQYKTHTVDEILLNEPIWEDEGDVAELVFEFKEDTVMVVPGRGLTELDCDVNTASCFTANYIAKAEIDNPSDDFTNGTYTSTSSGLTLNFLTNDYALVRSTASNEIQLYQWNGASFDIVVTSGGTKIFYNTNEQKWYYGESGGIGDIIWENAITSVSGGVAIGTVVPGSTVAIYSVSPLDVLTLIATGTDTEFAGAGIAYTALPMAKGIAAKMSNSTCGEYETTATYLFNFRCVITPIGAYDSQEDAITAGGLNGNYYTLTVTNVYGYPEGILMRINPNDKFRSDAEAGIMGVEDDDCFAVSVDNVYGAPEHAIRVLVDTTPVYLNDAAAATAGVAVNELYVYDGTESGISQNFVKKRIS